MNPQTLHIIDGKKEYFISPEEILFVKADGNYCDITLTTHTKYNGVRIQIGKFVQLLDGLPHGMVKSLHRIGRSYLINLEYLKYVDPKKAIVTLHTDKDVKVEGIPKVAVNEMLKLLSKERRKEVLKTVSYNQEMIVEVRDLNEEHHSHSGHEYVDLGLPSGTLWATENIGGDNPAYFSWGDLYESDKYEEDVYVHNDAWRVGKIVNEADSKNVKYVVGNDDDEDEPLVVEIINPNTGYELKVQYDVARQRWGGNWRMPTDEDVRELFEECTFTWCTNKYRQKGCLVTGHNGKRIFLPAFGYMKDTEVREKNVSCKYWTASSGKEDRITSAEMMILKEESGEVWHQTLPDDTYKGLAIRPVLSANTDEPPVSHVKRMLVIPEFDIGVNCFTIPPIERMLYNIHGWEMNFLDVPYERQDKYLEPEQLLDYVKRECEKRHPDLIVCFSSGCFFCKELEDYQRIFIAPDRTPSKIFMEWFEGEGSTDTEMEEIARKYKAIERKQVFKGNEDCWLFAESANYLYSHDDEYFGDWSQFQFPELERQGYWIKTFLYPFIKEVVEPGYSFGLSSKSPFASKVLESTCL